MVQDLTSHGSRRTSTSPDRSDRAGVTTDDSRPVGLSNIRLISVVVSRTGTSATDCPQRTTDYLGRTVYDVDVVQTWNLVFSSSRCMAYKEIQNLCVTRMHDISVFIFTPVSLPLWLI